jgi:hypothetical protein
MADSCGEEAEVEDHSLATFSDAVLEQLLEMLGR